LCGADEPLFRASSLVADLRWHLTTVTNSSSILPLSFFEAFRYLARISSAYSLIANLVIVTSNFGNTSFEATIPTSATVIMSQFGPVQAMQNKMYNWVLPGIVEENGNVL
jgi:hypothetical protein